MSRTPQSSTAFELQGDGLRVTYQPGDRLELRRGSELRTYRTGEFRIEPVSVGQLLTVLVGEPFTLLIPDVGPGGGPVSSIALTQPPGATGWTPILLRGHAGALAGQAAHEAAAAITPAATGGAGAGKALPVAFTSTLAVDKLLDPAPASASDSAADPDPVGSNPFTDHLDLRDPIGLHDDAARSDDSLVRGDQHFDDTRDGGDDPFDDALDTGDDHFGDVV